MIIEEKSSPAKDVDDDKMQAANLARLEAVKKKREEDRIKREAAAAQAEEDEKRAAEEKKSKKDECPKIDYTEVHAAIRKVLAEGKTFSLNQLNQDAACKKVLKPALKKAGVKTLNKKALEDIAKGQKDLSVS